MPEDLKTLTEGAHLPSPAARKAIRLASGVGLGELADWLEIDRHTLWRWETGRSEPHSPAARRAYSGALRQLRELADA
jgi:DNA-binding transcriptional regulator YiaG